MTDLLRRDRADIESTPFGIGDEAPTIMGGLHTLADEADKAEFMDVVSGHIDNARQWGMVTITSSSPTEPMRDIAVKTVSKLAVVSAEGAVMAAPRGAERIAIRVVPRGRGAFVD